MKIVDQTDFSNAINLPKKTIMMNGEFNKRESFFVEKMQDGTNFNDAREKNLENQKNINISQLPIEINHNVTPSTIINSVLKDIIARFAVLNGYNVNHTIVFFHTDDMLKKIKEKAVPEIAATSSSKGNKPVATVRKEIGLLENNRMGLEAHIRKQVVELMNLGVMINYTKHTYSTLKTTISDNMLTKFQQLYRCGSVFCSVRPVSWCTTCGNSIQQKDIKYKKSKIQSTYAMASIKEDHEKLKPFCTLDNTYVVFSSLRPWTLTTADKVVIAKESSYSIVEVDELTGVSNRYIIATHLVDTVMNDGFFIRFRTIAKIDDTVLQDIVLENPIDKEKTLTIVTCDKKYVLMDTITTTGINLLSKAHSYLDYLIYGKLGLADEKLIGLLDAKGMATVLLPKYKGIYYKEINQAIVQELKKNNRLFLQKDATTLVPRCRKCNEEVMYRIQNKWYLKRAPDEDKKLEQVFENLLLKTMTSHTKDTKNLKVSLNKIIKTKQLAISNEHKCNPPIPAFVCAQCSHIIVNDITIEKCKKIVKEQGIDTWNQLTPEQILTGEVTCDQCGCDFLFKDDNSLNDSFKLLTLPMFQVDKIPTHPDFKAKMNVNLCIENRKSFLDKIKVSSFDEKAAIKINSITKVMIHPKLQEKTFSLAEKDAIPTAFTISDIIKKYSIDVLRLWAIYRSNKASIRLTEGDIINIRSIYVKFRKTIKYILSNLYDFNPSKDKIPVSQREDLDCYLYYKMQKAQTRLDSYYGSLNFRGIYKTLFVFCVNTLEENYFESSKFTLYMTKPTSHARRSAQSTLYDLFELFLIYLEPILPLLFEESWPFIQHYSHEEEHNLLLFRKKQQIAIRELTPAQQAFEKIFSVKKKIIPYINQATRTGVIKNSLEASVTISCNEESVIFIKENYENLVRALNVSEIKAVISTTFAVLVEHASGVACAKCHNYSVDVGLDYEYLHLCPICAEIEAKGNDTHFIRTTFLQYPKDKEVSNTTTDDVQEVLDSIVPAPTTINLSYSDDRLGGDFDDYAIDPTKVTLTANLEQENKDTIQIPQDKEDTMEEIKLVPKEEVEETIKDALVDIAPTPLLVEPSPSPVSLQEDEIAPSFSDQLEDRKLEEIEQPIQELIHHDISTKVIDDVTDAQSNNISSNQERIQKETLPSSQTNNSNTPNYRIQIKDFSKTGSVSPDSNANDDTKNNRQTTTKNYRRKQDIYTVNRSFEGLINHGLSKQISLQSDDVQDQTQDKIRNNLHKDSSDTKVTIQDSEDSFRDDTIFTSTSITDEKDITPAIEEKELSSSLSKQSFEITEDVVVEKQNISEKEVPAKEEVEKDEELKKKEQTQPIATSTTDNDNEESHSSISAFEDSFRD